MANQESNTRLALIAIVVEDRDCVARLNELLHEYSANIIGRMGIPCPGRGVSLISVAVDASADEINALTGRLGRLEGLTARTVFSKV